MKKHLLLWGVLCLILQMQHSKACTNLIVSAGASKSKAVYLTYLNDGEWLNHFEKMDEQNYRSDMQIPFQSLSGIKYTIPQVEHTYGTMGFVANEHGLVIGETTFTGRPELWNKDNPVKYWELMELMLQRAKTAREAIRVMDQICTKYGYGSEGECFSIADTHEAWVVNLIGKGKGERGAIWVARRVPEGYVYATGNHARISTFPMNDPDNCLFSKDVISFAIERKYFDPKTDGPFRFNQVYNPATPEIIRYSETRVWSIFKRVNPNIDLDPNYHRGDPRAKEFPLWVKPAEPLGFDEIKELTRDHYEGTPYDMTKGVAAGPFASPDRYDPTIFAQDETGVKSWERPISTFKTCFSIIAELRSDVPDFLKAKIWYAVDDTYTNVYIPLYVMCSETPEAFRKGDINHYDPKVAWWAFNFVSNYINLRYSCMIKDVKFTQKQTEHQVMLRNALIEKVVMDKSKKSALKTLKNHSENLTNEVIGVWDDLKARLIVKYNDGYIKDSNNNIMTNPYSQNWLKTVEKYEGNKYSTPLN